MKEMLKEADEIINFNITLSKKLDEISNISLRTPKDESFYKFNKKLSDIYNTFTTVFINNINKIYSIDMFIRLYDTKSRVSSVGRKFSYISKPHKTSYVIKNTLFEYSNCYFIRDDEYVEIDDIKYKLKNNPEESEIFQMQLLHSYHNVLSYVVLCRMKKLDLKKIPGEIVFTVIHDSTIRNKIYSEVLLYLEEIKGQYESF